MKLAGRAKRLAGERFGEQVGAIGVGAMGRPILGAREAAVIG